MGKYPSWTKTEDDILIRCCRENINWPFSRVAHYLFHHNIINRKQANIYERILTLSNNLEIWETRS